MLISTGLVKAGGLLSAVYEKIKMTSNSGECGLNIITFYYFDLACYII